MGPDNGYSVAGRYRAIRTQSSILPRTAYITNILLQWNTAYSSAHLSIVDFESCLKISIRCVHSVVCTRVVENHFNRDMSWVDRSASTRYPVWEPRKFICQLLFALCTDISFPCDYLLDYIGNCWWRKGRRTKAEREKPRTKAKWDDAVMFNS